MGLKSVDSEFDTTFDSHAELDGLEEVGESVIWKKSQEIESG